MVTYGYPNTNCARPNVNELPRTDIQWLAAPFPSHSPFWTPNFGRASSMGKNQRGLRGFLKNNTASQLVWQEIVDFSS
jgi:hypothetical protein